VSIDQTERLERLSAAERALLLKAIREKVARLEKSSSIPRRAFRDGAPLSFAQQRLWFLDQLIPTSSLYNVTGAVRLEGRLNLEALERAINEIVRRHEVLRTRIEIEGSEPIQVIDEWEPGKLESTDLTGLRWEVKEEEFERIMGEEAETSFDLRRGPLLRVKVLRLEEEEFVLLYTMHHIVSDGWSMGILIRELGALYQAYSAGEQSPLAELPIQYADFAVCQREWLKGEVLEEKLEYWRKRLAGAEELKLPADHLRPAVRSYRGAGRHFVIESELAEKLRELSQREGATLFMTLLGGFDVLMSRYSGQEDVVLGTDVANRDRAEIEGLIGFFVNQLVLRVGVRTRESFGQLLKSVREICLGAYGHQDVPFEKLVEELHPDRGLSRPPFFQVKLILQNTPVMRLELERMRLVSIDVCEIKTAKFDLTLVITEMGGDLAGLVEYSRDLFEAETIERLMGHYTNVLRRIVEESGRPVGSLSLLSDQEREEILAKWNRTERPYPSDGCVHELFAEQVERAPDRMALIGDGGQVSYREFNRRANRLGRYLQRMGVGPEVVVGLCLERSVEMVVAVMGVLKAGGVYLPLDPEYPLERLSFMVEDAGVGVVLTERELENRVPAFCGQTVCLDEEWEKISEESEGNTESEVEAENLAYVIYTSGSTGRPKGVMVKHMGLCNLVEAQSEAFRLCRSGDQSRVLQFASLSFDASVSEIFSTLTAGGSVHVYERENLMPGDSLVKVLREDQITTVTLPPTVLALLEEEELMELETVIAAGEACSEEIIERWARGRMFIDAYGPTEATVCASIGECEAGSNRRPTIGWPIANTLIYILDGEMEAVPVGVRGELYIAGVGLARGYCGRPDLTAENFVPNNFSLEGGERLYRTGDMGRYLSDGSIEFIGRADAQVKIRGYRIELGEIEVVLNEHRSVRQCAVVAGNDKGGDKRLIGYVVGEETTSEELKRHLRQRLPEYMVPESIVVLEKMPVTTNGKIDRQRLLIMERADREPGREYVAPWSPVEEIVAGIFDEVLKLHRIGRYDNFFDVGGHSLLATQVISRVRNTFGVEIVVRSIFEEPTVEGLARKIEEKMRDGEKDEAPPLVRVSRGSRLPLSFGQQRLWFLAQLAPNNPFYNIPGAVRLEGRLDLVVLERAINEIVRRHEVLRTRFEAEAGEPVQVIDRWETRRLERVDLTGFTPEDREEEVSRIARVEAGTGFDLSRGPLLRVKVLELGEEEHILLFTMHHIVSDEWSMGILSREVGELYRAYSAGENSPLEELPIQYADFAVWQREWLQGEVLEQKLEYWHRQLAGIETLDLPTDHARLAVQSYRGASRHFVVETALAERLRELSRREGATLFMTLLGGFNILMSRYSGQEDVVLGTDIANRDRAEIEGLIGFFVNQLVLRVEVRGRESYGELLKRVREVCLEAYAHQDVPFEKLVAELQPERDPSRSPLFQVKLILQNAPREVLELEKIRLSSIGGSEMQTAKFDLTVAVTDSSYGLYGMVEYSPDLFDEDTIDRLSGHYTKLLRSIVEERGSATCDLSMLSELEREQMVVEWNRTGRAYPENRRIDQLIAEQGECCPDRIALIGEGGQVSYRELNRRANQLGHYLQRLGVGSEVVVGLCLGRSVEMVVAVVGVLKAGGAYLPLGPEYPLERLSLMVGEAGVGIVLAQRELEERLPASWGCVILLDEEWERISEESGSEPRSRGEAENLAYVIYTSGSTGRPKGVMVAHEGISNLAKAQKEAFRIGEQSRVLQFAELSFDASVSEIFSTLTAGVSLHVYGRKSLMPGEELRRVLREDGITTVTLPPTVMAVLEPEDVRGLETVIAAGERCGAEIVERLARGRRMLDAYGPTEATVCASIGECEAGGDREPSIGRPIANTKVYILDREMNPVPVGARGELYISGVGLARGYVGRPELTAERFIPHSLGGKEGERLYRTGDLVRYRTDGRIEFIGRADQQVKVRGYRIEPGEIEAVLNEHPLVKQSVVVASEDERIGKRLLGFVVGEAGARSEELKRHLRERVPEYMVPEAILLLEEMPMTVNGKIDRKRLSSTQLSRVVEREGDREYSEGQTPVEEMMTGIFKDVLGVERVGRRDNFFSLGGHSLLATQVVSRIREVFGVEMGVGSFFEDGTAERLGRRIEEAIKAGERDEAPPLVRVSREGRLPLSFAQQRLWFQDQLMPNNPLYNCPVAIRLQGRLDLEALERVINEIVRRHEVLRTRFEVEEGEPMQVISTWQYRRLEIVDLTSLTREEREEEATRIAQEESMTGFDLSRGPLLRVKVLRLDGDEYVVLFTMHHIVSDGWSIGILIREVGALYRAYSVNGASRAGAPSPLEELPVQYADFAVWQRNWLQGEVLDRKIEYWRKRLAGMEGLELPADHPRPAVRSYRGATRHFVVERELAEKMRGLSQRESVTLFMTLLGVFDVLMSRYSGQEDVVLGIDIANRNRAEIEGLIGFFVNQLVLRVDVRAEESFNALLKRVREVCLEAYAHQDVPFEKLVEALQPERDLSRSPLFQAKLVWQSVPSEWTGLGGAEVSNGDWQGKIVSERGTAHEVQMARFDLTVAMTDDGRDLVGTVNYSRDLFEPETIERLLGHYRNLLKAVVKDSERPVWGLNWLSDQERAQIVVEWNETIRSYPQDRCIHELFTEQSERAPDRVALSDEDRQFSYGELNRRANQLGSYLQRLGVGPDVVVGVCLERSIEMIVASMGALKAGGAYLPLDPESPLERFALMLDDAEVGVVLTHRELADHLPAFRGQTICLDEEWERIGEESEGDPGNDLGHKVLAEHLAYVIYTSGSTGQPKGVAVSHRSLVNLVCWHRQEFNVSPSDHATQLAGVGFDASIWEAWPYLTIGASLHIVGEARRRDIPELIRWMVAQGITIGFLPTPLAELALQEPWPEVSCFRVMLIGGDKLRTGAPARLPFRVVNNYGPTECTVVTTCAWLMNGCEGIPPIGSGIANTRVYLLDRRLEPVPVGVRGELYIGGEGLARGYLGPADLTAERFLPNPFGEDGGRFYRTGDWGRFQADGTIEYLGRLDDQVKVRGYRVELGEIESVLNEHSSVKQSAVVAIEDERRDKRLLGYVVGENGVTVQSLKAYLRERFPEYMIPGAILMLEEMPLTANGKIDRKRLPSAKDFGGQGEQEYLGPRTPVEELLAGIFEELLRLDRVGIRENFFEIGGHSLLATQVVSRARRVFGAEIGVKSIFENPTVEGLANTIEEAVSAGEWDEVPPLVRVARDGGKGERLPLSFAQQRLWFIEQLGSGKAAYNIPGAVRLEGRLKLEVLERVINEIVRRHQVLRTRIEEEEGEPVQVIGEWEARELDVEDLRSLPPEEREKEVTRIGREEAWSRFDLSRGLVLRVKVLKLGEEEHVLLYTMHHIMSDGWSMGILIREVGELYRAYSEGEESPLAELPIQYADYAVWQREWLRGETLERQMGYWRRRLEGAPAALELPTDRPRPLVKTYRGAHHPVSLPGRLAESLPELSQREGVTLFMTLLGAYQVLLSRYSGQQEVTVGTDIANRNRVETEGLIGFFVNQLALRSCLKGEKSFRRLLEETRDVCLGAYAHQDVPFEKLVEELHPERDLSRSPLFQAKLVLQNAPVSELELPGLKLRVESGEGEVGTAKFELTLVMEQRADGIGGWLEYDTDLYEAGSIERMLTHYRVLLEGIVENPESRLKDLPLLDEAEKDQIVYEWNETWSEYPRDRCIHDVFEEQAERTPEAIAVVCGDQEVSYWELNVRANRLANHLRGMGVGPEMCVGVSLERSVEMVVVMLGILKAGGAYLPLDPEYPLERLSFMLEEAEAGVVVTMERWEEKLPSGMSQVICLDREREQIESQKVENPEAGANWENAAYVIYTSGSTGRPKGVTVVHRGVLRLVKETDYVEFEEGDVYLQLAPVTFDAATFEVWGSLLNGGRLVVMEPEKPSLWELGEKLRQHGVTTLWLTAGLFHEMVEQEDESLGGVRQLLCGGDVLSVEHVRQALERLGEGHYLINGYGPTESTTFACCQRMERGSEVKGSVEIGRPIKNTRVYVLEGAQEAVPVGVKGEICIGGEGLARGYTKRAEMTAERFIPDPYGRNEGERVYRTGDIGRYLPDGRLEFIGREDQQVKIRGYRIELGEIEAVIKQHPDVKQAVAVVQEEEAIGRRLVVYYTGEGLGTETLRAHLSKSLPGYMVPAAYVRLESWPLTSNGKLDRRRLPSPDTQAYVQRGYEPPVGETEEKLARIWSDLLKLERVDRHDNFFELGGHSLLAVRVLSRLRQSLGVSVSLVSLFTNPVLADFASAVEGATQAELPPITPVDRDNHLELSFAQQRLWFLGQFKGGSEAYHIAGGLRLAGDLDREALRRALDQIVARHETLRTTFSQVEGRPVQIIGPPESGCYLQEHDLRHTADGPAELNRLAILEAGQPFDFERGPLIRGRLVQLADDDHVLLLTMHHIVSDGWSMGILINELSELYRAYRLGESPELPDLPIQYADYAAWQRRWLNGIVLQRQAEYWKGILAGAPPLLELPSDRPRPAEQDYTGDILQIELEPDLTRDLKALSRKHGATLYMTLLAGWAALLARLSGQDEVVIGTPVANRMRLEIELLIGFFVNTQALRIDLSGPPSVVELLRRVKTRTLEAQQNQDIPFEQVVEMVQPPRNLKHAPIFQAMFAWQNAPEGRLDLPGLTITSMGTPQVRAIFDLSLSLQEAGERIVGMSDYATALFDRATVQRYLGYWRILLEGIAVDEAQAIDRLPLLSESERRQVLAEWNATEADYPKEKCLHELFEEQVEKSPEAIALVCEEQSLTYAELNVRANRLAAHLCGLGVGPEVRAAICMVQGVEMVVALLATLKTGGAYVPLDPSYPPERLAYMIEDSSPAVLLTHEAALAALAGHSLALPILNLNSDAPQWAGQSECNPDHAAIGVDPRNLAYVIYTSGSTGTPKGAMNEHRAVVNRLFELQRNYGIGAHDVVLQKTTFSFDTSVWEFFCPLLFRGRLIVASPDGHKDPRYLVRIIQQQNITSIDFVPSMLQAFLEDHEASGCRNLIRVLCGGETLPASLARRFYERLPDTDLHNLYGPTETAIDATAWNCRYGIAGSSVPIGRPIANARIYILDSYHKPAPIGVAGEIYIGGVQVGRGYLNRAELTTERFLPDPFGREPGARIYRTGDLGRWLPGGNIEFIGRNDFQVKLRGFRIELGEIEARLAEHPAVREAAVLVREDGETGKRLVAYYTGEESGVETLRSHLSSTLPEYMVPAAYVHLQSLPLLPNGKLDRRALPALGAEAYLLRDYEPPVGETETRLAQIWADLLKLERVGREDNFFELGGHSLLVISMVERMRREGMGTDVRTLFTAPTLKSLAEVVAGASRAKPAGIEVPPNLIPSGCRAIIPEMLPLVKLTQEEIDAIVAGVPGGAANVQDIYPLAPLQEGILFHHLMETRGDAYLLHGLLAFDRRERLEGFIGALRAVIARHDILRTAMAWEGLTEPVQVVWREAPLEIEEVVLDPSEGEAACQLRERFDPRQIRLDLRRAPLMRCIAAQDGASGRWLLMWLLHHLTGDQSAQGIMIEEAQAYLLGEAGRLPDPLPFRNLVAQARLGSEKPRHESFFREMLGDVEEPTAPFGLLDVQRDGSGIEESHLEVEEALGRRMRERARALRVSAASLCHVACGRVLARVSGREDVVFGTVLFGRMGGGEGAGRVLGMFINTLPIRLSMGRESVEGSVRRAHTLLGELMLHEHASLALAQRCSGVTAPAPLFSSLLNYRHSPRKSVELPEAARAWAGVEVIASEERTNYPLVMSVDDLGDGFLLTAQAVKEIEPGRLCEMMRTALEGLVEALERAPESAVREIDVMPEAERRQVEEWNATEADYPAEKCIHQLFEEQASRTPDAVAVICGEQQVAYGELNGRANQVAHYLRRVGVGPEMLVGLCMERSVEAVVGLLGILKAGGAYLPLDPEYPRERLAHMLEQAQVSILLTQRRLLEALPKYEVETICLDWEWEIFMQESMEDPPNNLSPDNVAYAIYTSGSTGRPRGVLASHRASINRFSWMWKAYPFEREEVGCQKTSLSFVDSVWEIWGYLLRGIPIVIIPGEVVENPEQLLEVLEEREVTRLVLVPSLLSALLKSDADLWRRLPGLKLWTSSGEALPAEVARDFLKAGPESRLLNLYGSSEVAADVTCHEVGRDETASPQPIGRAIANTKIHVVDRYLRAVPVGVSGEICVGGAGLARGYLGQPELTAEKFIPNAYSGEKGGRAYKMGDLGRYRPDGRIEFLGRIDQQVKVRGFRIELGEIEVRIAEHPAVREAVTLARDDGITGKRLVAYYTGVKIRAEALRAHLASTLPEYMVPSAYVHLEQMPLTPNGKVDRRALPPPGAARPELDGQYVGTLTPTEEILSGIWGEVLGMERVGAEESFFELGGHSLLATQVMSRIRAVFGVELPLRVIFEHPTVRGVARDVEKARAEEIELSAPPLVRASREQALPLSFAQQRLWFLDQLVPNNPFYNIPRAVRLKGRLDLEVLERGINEIVRRHEILRTRFEVEEDEPMQVIDEWEPRKLEVGDLTDRTREEKEAWVSRMAREEAGTEFDLRRGPLLRVKVLRLEENEHVVLFTMSHIVCDGWSMGILIREVGALYQAYSRGEESPLEELPIQYGDFAVWQRKWLQGEVLKNQLAYWKRQLGGELPVLELPTDKPRPAVPTYRGAERSLKLSRALLDSLKVLSLEQSSTLFMTLLAAFKTLLSYLTGQTDICVGTDVANRNRAETEKLIGFFVNQLVLRTELSRNSTFKELLRRVREITLGAYSYQDLPFEKLVEILNPDRDESRTPLFQVKIVLQNAVAKQLSLPGLTLSPETVFTDTAKFDLLLDLIETEDGLDASLQYNTDLFEESTPIRILNRFQALLERVGERPDARVQELIESLIEDDKREELDKDQALESIRLRRLKSIKRRVTVETHVQAE
jgi:amino acid adenylation domain-containing protein